MSVDVRPVGKFGALPPKDDPRTLKFGNYLTPWISPPPPSYSALPSVLGLLSGSTIPSLFPMDGNDHCSDCTIAALAHAITVWRGVLGSQLVLRREDVIELYFQLTGGADTGLSLLDVLNFWRHNFPTPEERIIAYVKVEVHNHQEVKQAIRIFKALYLGFQVTEDCERQFSNQEIWTPGPLLNEGHAIVVPGYTDAGGDDALTWGGQQGWTWDWWDSCVKEAYAILPAEAADPAFEPGLNLIHLQADLAAIGESIEPPTPPRPFVVTPPPPPIIVDPGPDIPPPPPIYPPVVEPEPDPFNVGDGVRWAMKQCEDEPATNEVYLFNEDGSNSGLSLTRGVRGLLYAYAVSTDDVSVIQTNHVISMKDQP